MPAERETFIKVSDHMPEHPKIEGLTDRAFRANMDVWCWCSRNRTNGHVPAGIWAKRAPGKVGRELVAAGLYDEVAGEIWAHDYLKHQRSREHIEALSEKRATAGRSGGKARTTGKQDRSKLLSKTEAEGTPEDRGSTTYFPDREPEKDPQWSPQEGGAGETASRKRSAEARGTRLPESWQPSDDDIAWFREHCPDLSGRGRELTAEFRDYWLAKAGKDARKVDWNRTWRNRMRDRQGQAQNRRLAAGGRTGRPTTDDKVHYLQSLKTGGGDA